MSPEENLWVLLVQCGVTVLPRQKAADLMLQARQEAYEDCARLIEERGGNPFYHALDPKLTAVSIRQRLKELKGE